MGWSVEITAPRRDKCVICVAPHTSNWDFIFGLFAYYSLGRKANFLIKDTWFFFPLNIMFRHLGGIPVSRKRSTDLVSTIVKDYSERSYLNLAVTPEGTRSASDKWRTGFLRIACGAGVPLQLGVLDYKRKCIVIKDEYQPTCDVEKDLEAVKNYYRNYGECARYPEKFKI